MSFANSLPKQDLNPDAGWTGLYRLAGIASLLSVALLLLDIALTFIGADVEMGTLTAVEWFAYFQANPFLGLRIFGLINITNLIISIPLYLALCWLHRKTAAPWAALGLIIFLLGVAVYLANNQALTMLSLSSRYAVASPAEQSLLAAAGTGILAQAEDFTPGTFLGFLLSNSAPLIVTAAMLHGNIFRKWIALVGMVGTACLFVFTVVATFIPALFDLVMLLAVAGGLLMIVWNISVALRLFRLSRSSVDQHIALSAPARLTAAG